MCFWPCLAVVGLGRRTVGWRGILGRTDRSPVWPRSSTHRWKTDASHELCSRRTVPNLEQVYKSCSIFRGYMSLFWVCKIVTTRQSVDHLSSSMYSPAAEYDHFNSCQCIPMKFSLHITNHRCLTQSTLRSKSPRALQSR